MKLDTFKSLSTFPQKLSKAHHSCLCHDTLTVFMHNGCMHRVRFRSSSPGYHMSYFSALSIGKSLFSTHLQCQLCQTFILGISFPFSWSVCPSPDEILCCLKYSFIILPHLLERDFNFVRRLRDYFWDLGFFT